MISSIEKIDVIEAFRDMCTKKYSKDIYPLSSENKDDRLTTFNRNIISDFLFYEFGDTPAKQVSSLMKTPRLLKMTLRKTLRAWKALHGEIDFNDLIVTNVLRYGAPEAFEFILEHFREIRQLERDGVVKNRDQRKKDLKSKWDNALSNVTWDKSASENLVSFLFPSWSESGGSNREAVVQGVRIAEPTDYWQRLNIEDLSNVEVLDQEILSALKKWKSNQSDTSYRNNTLPWSLINNKSCVAKIAQFAHVFLDGYNIRDLSQSLFGIILEKDAQAASEKNHEAFAALWRLSLSITIDQKEHEGWILKEIKKAFCISIQFANDLYYYWKHHNQESAKSSRPPKDLRDNIVQYAKDRFSGNTKELIKILDPNHVYSLYHFSFFFSSEEEGGRGFIPNDWIWLANVMIDAAEQNPKLLVPQIVNFLMRNDRVVGEHNHQVETKFANSLFQDRFAEVMNIISIESDYTHLEKSDQDRISFAKNYAKNWMHENNEQEN